MGKHETGYPRVERDYYPTPSWVIDALVEHVDIEGLRVWEPACGDGRGAEALKTRGAIVQATDIEDRGYAHLDGLADFTLPSQLGLFDTGGHAVRLNAIITNPPLGPRGTLAVAFIEAGLVVMEDGFLALLLPADFDHAKTRRRLFGL